MAATVLPYELYSDSPGFLLNKPEWEAANSAHAQDTDFGDIPQGWPKKLSGPLVWSGEDLRAQPEKWVHVLNDSDISEIDNATKHFKSLSIPLSELARNHFPLPSLGQVLRNISHNIYHGTGINLLRGIPVEKYEKDELVIVCLGLNSWVGDQRLPQGIRRGLCHIKSIAHIERTKRGAIYVSAQNAAAQMYHSDAGADVVSLMAVSVPENSQGGESKIASAWRVYNHLAEHRPDILRLLGERRFRWRACVSPVPHLVEFGFVVN
ncbi:taurine catabolism dioxygenase family protein [Neofusicoccum parvum]|nr:taurine catabolism dioxygenase family protein [Neofusicoccum parvum]